MSDVVIYHPGTGLRESVPEESVPHHRRSGWRLLSEHEEDEARAAAGAEAAASKPSAKKGDQ